MVDAWQYREDIYVVGTDLRHFGVEAADGHLGSVDAHAVAPGFLVVATGSRGNRRKLLLPAGLIDRIDYEQETLHVALTLVQINGAPDLDPAGLPLQEACETFGSYFESLCR